MLFESRLEVEENLMKYIWNYIVSPPLILVLLSEERLDITWEATFTKQAQYLNAKRFTYYADTANRYRSQRVVGVSAAYE